MTEETLAAALEREHDEIDRGIAEFVAGLDVDELRADPLARAIRALRRHVHLEEEYLFPPMRSGGLMAAVVVMYREHGRIWRLMDSLETMASTGADLAVVGEEARKLIDALNAHNLKEEAVIYPETDASLTPERAAELRRFLADGTMPAGWICRGAASS